MQITAFRGKRPKGFCCTSCQVATLCQRRIQWPKSAPHCFPHLARACCPSSQRRVIDSQNDLGWNGPTRYQHFIFLAENHKNRITESLCGLGWKRPQSPHRPNPSHGQGCPPPAQAAQSPIQPGLECLQGWGTTASLGSCVSGTTTVLLRTTALLEGMCGCFLTCISALVFLS